MSKKFALRHTTFAVASLIGLMSVSTVQIAAAAEKANTKAAGTYVTGDFHNHTTCSDGQISMQKLIDKSVKTFGLDWFVQADHGGSSARNCTLREDPFEPVVAGGQPASALKGPNQSWESTLPGGRAAIKGDGTANPKAMWRWQEIQEFQYKVTEDESRARQKPIWIGVEQNTPGHEHASTGCCRDNGLGHNLVCLAMPTFRLSTSTVLTAQILTPAEVRKTSGIAL